MKTNKIKIATVFLLTIILAFQGCASNNKGDIKTENEVKNRNYKPDVISGKYVFSVNDIYQDTTATIDGVTSSLGISETSTVKYETKRFEDNTAKLQKKFVFEGQTHSLYYCYTDDNGYDLYDMYCCSEKNFFFIFDTNGFLRLYAQKYPYLSNKSESQPLSLDEAEMEAKRIVGTYMGINTDNYSLTYREDLKCFIYQKYVNGYEAKYDYINICLNFDTGELESCDSGNQVGAFSPDLEIEYDQEAVEKKLKALIIANTAGSNEENMSFSFKHELVWVNTGVIGFEVEVSAQYDDETNWRDYTYIFTILSDGSLVSGDQPVLD